MRSWKGKCLPLNDAFGNLLLQRRPDLTLVLVNMGAIDEAVAGIDGVFYSLLDLTGRRLGSKSKSICYSPITL